MTSFESALTLLKQNGYKLTTPRKNVLKILVGTKTPLSPYDIQKQLPEEKKLEAVSIYRILDVFESLCIVHKVLSAGGFLACNAQGEKGCHHFLICEECAKVEEVIFQHHDEESEERKILQKRNFTPRGHVHEIRGICQSCAV